MENEKNHRKIIEQDKMLMAKEKEIKDLRDKFVGLENFNEECIFQKRFVFLTIFFLVFLKN